MGSQEAKERPRGLDSSSGKVLIVSTPSGEQGWLFKEFMKELPGRWEVVDGSENWFETIDRCKCGAVAEVGCHGIRDGGVYSEHWCEACYKTK